MLATKYADKIKTTIETQQEILDAATIRINDPSQLDRKALYEILDRDQFAVIKGVVSESSVRDAVKRIKAYHDPKNDHPATGEDPDDIMQNFQKLSIGGAEHSGTYRPRCMRTFYNPLWATDTFGLHDALRKMAQVRNVLYGFDLNFAIDRVEDEFWTAARIHHYPAGGGFLIAHRDDASVSIVQNILGLSDQFFQPVLCMSKKGKGPGCDFETGGGFFDLRGERCYYEHFCDPGDIVIYSGLTVHGVADIDLHKTFDSHSPEGRFGGFVTIYRRFERKNQLEDFINRKKIDVY